MTKTLLIAASLLFAAGLPSAPATAASKEVQVIENGRNLNGRNLNGRNLNGRNLNGRNLNGRNLNGTELAGAGTRFEGSRILRAVLPNGTVLGLE